MDFFIVLLRGSLIGFALSLASFTHKCPVLDYRGWIAIVFCVIALNLKTK